MTLGEASRLTGLGKSTLARAIAAGRLTATRTETGSYAIDGAELARVYPDETAVGTRETVPAAQAATPDATALMIAELRRVIERERETAEHWRLAFEDERAQRQRLLVAPAVQHVTPGAPPKTPTMVSEPPPTGRTAGARMRGFLFESDPIWTWWGRRRSA